MMKRFADENPNVFAKREIRVEVWNIVAHYATCIASTRFPEPIVNVPTEEEIARYAEMEDEETLPNPKRYPDKEMFPGSVMQFVKPVATLFYAESESD